MSSPPTKPTAAGLAEWLRSATGRRHGHYIAGEWHLSASQREIFNPADPAQLLGLFAEGTAEDAARAVDAAHEAFVSWRAVPGPERGAILYRAADLIEAELEEIAYILSAEQGKVLGESVGEIGRAVRELRFAAGEAFRAEGTTQPSEKINGLAFTLREPLGVVAAITPWNFPVATPIRKIGPALAYGCAVVLKPSELTPWSAIKLVGIFERAGLPKGVLSLVLGGGAVGRALVENPRVAGISFTGSTGTGAAINGTAAARFARTQLEMGGKNPAVVLDASDLAGVAGKIVAAAFICGGQRCTSISRVIAVRELAAPLGEALIAAMRRITLGPATDAAATMGPMVSANHRAGVLRAIEEAVEEGARPLYAGTVDADLAGHFVAPVLLGDVTPQMAVARREIFGPVLTLQVVADAAEALRVANDVDYGLAASVFTGDLGKAMAFMRGSETGMVHIGHGTNSEAHIPFGGVKSSGYGAFSIGHSNQEFYTTIKAVYVE